MQLNGIHHVTAVSGRIGHNADFYTRVLGLRLVKKSVNQDDVSAYHLFYADKIGSPGTDMTFFDWPQTGPDQRGTDSIALTAFRVNGQASLDYWQKRFVQLGVAHSPQETFAERMALRFEDPEGQRLMLIDDGGAPVEGELWDRTDVPLEYAIRGFHAVMLSIPSLRLIEPILTGILQFTRAEAVRQADGREVTIFSMAKGGPGREVWVIEEPGTPVAWLGAGGVHHVAFRVTDFDEQRYWHERITGNHLPASSFVDRFWFRSIYFRISRGILFEIATDGPGFGVDEDMEHLGEKLVLPPFLEPRRTEIEAGLKPIVVTKAV
ncbi:MAG: ring-cleaving dioxygenase [Anaerolineae bacterium]|nr:ring-cleaving dioxygenase [Anaerolineae bacterium]